tara:strand:+ start:1004 stop:1846 length:843 start_codon:yes stop_codon:yes gene_type:complete
MQIAAFADEINREQLTRAVQLATRWGVGAVEIRSLPGGRFPRGTAEELHAAGRLITDAGLVVSGVSPGLFKCAVEDDEVTSGIAELLPRACEWACQWGTERVSIFGTGRGDSPHGSGQFPPQVVDTLGRMCDVALASGCRLGLENEAICWGDTGAEAAALIRAVGSDRLTLCWDPGNSARAGAADTHAEYEDLADLVTHVHLKNFDAEAAAWSLLDSGVIDWSRQLHALTLNDYSGYLVIETHTATEPANVTPLSEAGEKLAPLEANTLRNLRHLRALLD